MGTKCTRLFPHAGPCNGEPRLIAAAMFSGDRNLYCFENPLPITPSAAMPLPSEPEVGDVQVAKPASDAAKAMECTCPPQHGKGPRIRMNCPAHGVSLDKPLRPKTSAERKAEPIHSGVMLYFPDALAAVARVSKAGNDKHNPGEPMGWARGKSMDQMDAAARHMLTLEKVDPETNEVEAAANAWRALAELQLIEEKRLKAAGIMPYSGIVP